MKVSDPVPGNPAVITRRVGTNHDVLKRIGLYTDLVLSDQVHLSGATFDDDIDVREMYSRQLRAKVLSDAERKKLPRINPDLDPDEARERIPVPLLNEQTQQVQKALSLVRAAKQRHSDKHLSGVSIEFHNYVDLVKEIDIDHLAIHSNGEIIDESVLALAVHYTLKGDNSFLTKVPKGFIDPDQVEASTQRAATLMKLFYASEKNKLRREIRNALELENLSDYRRWLEKFGVGYLTHSFDIGYLVDASVPNWMHDETDPILRPWRVANGSLLKALEDKKFSMIDRLAKFVARRRLRIVKPDGRLDLEKLTNTKHVAEFFRKELADWKGHSGFEEIFPLLQRSFPLDLGYGLGQADDRSGGFSFNGRWNSVEGHERFRSMTFRSMMDAGLGKDNPNTKYTENGFELHYTLEEFKKWRDEYFKKKDWEKFFKEFRLKTPFDTFCNKSSVSVHRVLFPEQEEIDIPAERMEDPIQSPIKICGEYIPVEEFILGNSGKVDASGRVVLSTTVKPGGRSVNQRINRSDTVKNQPKELSPPKLRKQRPAKEPRPRREPKAQVFGPPRPRREPKASVTVEAKTIKIANKVKSKIKEIADAALGVINGVKGEKPKEINQTKGTISDILTRESENIIVVDSPGTLDAESLSKKIEEVEKKIEDIEDAKYDAEKNAEDCIKTIDREVKKVSNVISRHTGRINDEEKKLGPEMANVLEQISTTKNEITQTENSVKAVAEETKREINNALGEVSREASRALETLRQALGNLEREETESVSKQRQEQRDAARRQRQEQRDSVRRAKEAEKTKRNEKAQALSDIRSTKSQAKKDIKDVKDKSIRKSKEALRTIEKIKTNPRTYEQAKKIASTAKIKIAEIPEKALAVISPLGVNVPGEINAKRDVVISALQEATERNLSSKDIEALIGEISKVEDECKKISTEAIAKIDKELGLVIPKISPQIDVVGAEEVKINSAKSALEGVINSAESAAKDAAQTSITLIDAADKRVKDLIDAKREIIQENLPEPIEGVDGVKGEIGTELEKVTTAATTAKQLISCNFNLINTEVSNIKQELTQAKSNIETSASNAKNDINTAVDAVSGAVSNAEEKLGAALVKVGKREQVERAAIEAQAEKAKALITVIKAPCERKELLACRMRNDNDDVSLPSVFSSGNMGLICKVADAFVLGSQNPSNSSLESLLLAKSPGGGNEHILSDNDVKKLLNIVRDNLDDFDKIGLKDPAKEALLAALNPLASGKDDVRNILLAAHSVSKNSKLPGNTDSLQILDTFIKYIIGNATIKAIENKTAKRKRVHSSIESFSVEVTQKADRLKAELEKHWNGIYLPFRKSYPNVEEAYHEATDALGIFRFPGKIKSEFYNGLEMINDEELLKLHVLRVVKAKYDAKFNKNLSNKAIEKTFMKGELFERDVEYVGRKYGLDVSEEVAMIALGKSVEEGKNITLVPEGLINPHDSKFALRVSALWRYAMGS